MNLHLTRSQHERGRIRRLGRRADPAPVDVRDLKITRRSCRHRSPLGTETYSGQRERSSPASRARRFPLSSLMRSASDVRDRVRDRCVRRPQRHGTSRSSWTRPRTSSSEPKSQRPPVTEALVTFSAGPGVHHFPSGTACGRMSGLPDCRWDGPYSFSPQAGETHQTIDDLDSDECAG